MGFCRSIVSYGAYDDVVDGESVFSDLRNLSPREGDVAQVRNTKTTFSLDGAEVLPVLSWEARTAGAELSIL